MTAEYRRLSLHTMPNNIIHNNLDHGKNIITLGEWAQHDGMYVGTDQWLSAGWWCSMTAKYLRLSLHTMHLRLSLHTMPNNIIHNNLDHGKNIITLGELAQHDGMFEPICNNIHPSCHAVY
eukprot:CAMPEP_0172301120 /NCGR_PEP_ID=MMETSP1058-20130122/3068_1 /TAXON_ID=83371 /ORGANISM="Detonula confervacea, Strain CCMP 353" /LENGTH=120 /DNA_ID=CAMNT_0013011129 /DNA_START=321 /DNA_END=683 /DNA_ORIENTATION=+